MTTSDIPQGWQIAPLSDLVTIVRGVTYKKSESSITPDSDLLPVLRANNIQRGQLVFDDLVYVPAEKISEQQKVRKGDIVVAMSSGSRSVVGKSSRALDDWNGGFGAFCGVLRPSALVSKRYVNWFTWSLDYRNRVSELAAGVNINNLKPSHFDEVSVPLAPGAEQKEIAAKLDQLLAQVDTIKARLDAIPAILKRFRQSLLAGAVTGKLVEGGSFVETTIGDVSAVIGGLTKNSQRKDLPRTIDYLRVANVYENELRLHDVSKIGIRDKELPKVLLKAGDLLVVEGNGSIDQIGRVALWNGEISECVHQNHLIKVRAGERLLPRYALCYLMSPQGKAEIVSKATSGAGLYTLSISKISSIRISLPSKEDQAKIVRRVDELFAFADQIEQRVEAAQARVNQLTQSILAKAFRGELTAEWREEHPDLITGENSADALLARIRAERANATKPRRGRRRASA